MPRRATAFCLSAALCFVPFTLARAESLPESPPESPVAPRESLRYIETHPDVRVELVACEPQVVDPVAMAFDEAGRLYVVEMSDYPNGPAEGKKPQSKIKLLEDRGGDGFYETAHLFADGLLFANGVLPWRGGVIVTMAGEVAYLKDTDGDHKANVRETWFTGFAEENPQLRANHPTLGPDGWVYVANGLRGGTVIAKKAEWAKDAKPVSLSGRDFRFHPLTGEYEAVTGVGQFGLTFDDWGRRFVCSNRNPCKQIMLEEHYLKRNPHLAVSATAHDVSPPAEASRVYPLVNAWTTSTLHAGQFTAACGVLIYRGDALGEAFYGNSFTCEPTGSLIHRDVLTPDGATFQSKPGREGKEFLASRDPWFRAVNLAHGPDGALYVCDMYRAVIEHPQFMPSELKNRRDLRDGDDRGRIYRVVAKTFDREESVRPVHPDSVSKMLAHPNVWQRETAARLIFEQQPKNARRFLDHLLRTAERPASRAAALGVLEVIGRMTLAELTAALQDESPRVREVAVRLAEPMLDDHPDLLRRVRELAAHPDARLRFQVALSLGEAEAHDETVEALAAIAARAGGDEWVRLAVLTSAAQAPVRILKAVLGDSEHQTTTVAREFADLIGSRQQADEIRQTLALLAARSETGDGLAAAGLQGLGDGLARRGGSLSAHIEKLDPTTKANIVKVFQRAVETARDRSAAASRRTAAVSLLRYAAADVTVPALMPVATGEPSQTVRVAAIGTLSRFSDPRIGAKLLEDYAAQTPAVRGAILDALLARPDRVALLLDSIESGGIAMSELGPSRVTRLTKHRDAAVRGRAAELVAASVPADRREVMEKYQAALKRTGNAAAGRAVFEKNCATCHRIGDIGVNVAPDIADSRTRTPEYLLTNILDPNRAVDSNYFSFTVLTTDGQVHTGLVDNETATSVTLRQPEGKTVTLLREDIGRMKSDGVSLMPVGLEKTVTVEQMADLISFIKNWRYLGGDIPIDVPGK